MIAFVFFLMRLPPPRFTLFPYPTLFRSRVPGGVVGVLACHAGHDVVRGEDARAARKESRQDRFLERAALLPRGSRILRSEEHTSELQSHSDIVCRLLLDNKNTRMSATLR